MIVETMASAIDRAVRRPQSAPSVSRPSDPPLFRVRFVGLCPLCVCVCRVCKCVKSVELAGWLLVVMVEVVVAMIFSFGLVCSQSASDQ